MRANMVEYYGYGRDKIDAFVDALNQAINDKDCDTLSIDMLLECYVRDWIELDNGYEEVSIKYSYNMDAKIEKSCICTLKRERI